MRLLLDENVPIRFVAMLPQHATTHVRELRWLGIPDVVMAQRAVGNFDAIITMDQAFPAEIDGLEEHPAVIVMSPRSHRLTDVAEMIPAVLESLKTIRNGEIVRLFRPPSVLT